MFKRKVDMRIRIALAILILISLGQASAFPAQINNQNPAKGNTVTMTHAVAPKSQVVTTISPQPPKETVKPQIVPETPAVSVVKEEPVIPVPPTPPSQVTCGDNIYANYIYMHESGCSTRAVNSIGCRGIGQSCPGSKLPCGDDYVCQNNWFTNYAIARYGSWKAAYETWLVQHWW